MLDFGDDYLKSSTRQLLRCAAGAAIPAVGHIRSLVDGSFLDTKRPDW
ncbi:hypothetical protein MIZ03_0609 [Rhodoferax lithotrophicus]|uniref:Uncharacterized protein n=1 Tax=Rhodoferax lithotrophicus TaxID=2798804 RepID=A0ABM7MHN1_9BURK|nr:hypothetical protein MIZ03_0609 [Rhodoferax sp. MIZ03]